MKKAEIFWSIPLLVMGSFATTCFSAGQPAPWSWKLTPALWVRVSLEMPPEPHDKKLPESILVMRQLGFMPLAMNTGSRPSNRLYYQGIVPDSDDLHKKLGQLKERWGDAIIIEMQADKAKPSPKSYLSPKSRQMVAEHLQAASLARSPPGAREFFDAAQDKKRRLMQPADTSGYETIINASPSKHYSVIDVPLPAAEAKEAETPRYWTLAKLRSEISRILESKFAVLKYLVEAIIAGGENRKLDTRAISMYKGKPVAFGLMQITQSTGQSECGATREDLFDPQKNLKCGYEYVKKLYIHFSKSKYWKYGLSTFELVAAAYNAGPGRLQRALANYGSVPVDGDNGHTPGYVRAVMRFAHSIFPSYRNHKHRNAKSAEIEIQQPTTLNPNENTNPSPMVSTDSQLQRFKAFADRWILPSTELIPASSGKAP